MEKKQVAKLIESKVPFMPGRKIRMMEKDGEPWFVARDLCVILDLGNPTQVVKDRDLDDDEKGLSTAETLGGAQEMLLVSESGMYALIMGSKKPEAKEFGRWVRKELLPSIRRTGAYISDAATPDQVEYILENQIVEKLRRSILHPKVKITPMLGKLIVSKGIRGVMEKSLPYIESELAGMGKDRKLMLAQRLDDSVQDYGAEQASARKLDGLNLVDLMQLRMAIRDMSNRYLMASRGQSVRQLKAKIKEGGK